MCKLKEVLKSEANEYFEYNEKSKGVLFFMLDINDFDEYDEYGYTIYKDDSLVQIDNKESEV